ncbi:MAG TPA: hypothetical protein VFZ18_15530 [Longimicrobiaceae bacterium]
MNTPSIKLEAGQQVTVTLLESDHEDMRDARPVLERTFRRSGEGGAFEEVGGRRAAGEREPVAGGAEAAAAALAIGKEVWSIIKDNQPDYTGSTPSSFVLHEKDRNGMHYPGAKEFQSKWYRFVDRNWTGAEMDSFKFRVYGEYRAQPPAGSGIPRGDYLPNIGVSISDVQVNFANWLDVSAALENVGNAGTEEQYNPRVMLKIRVKSRGMFQTHGFEYNFRVTGRDGAVLVK